MSEHTNGSLHPTNSRVDASSTGSNELAALDLTDLAGAIEMVKSSDIGAEPLCTLLRNELSRVKDRVDALVLRLNQSALELRQLRESVPEALLRNEEERRQLQEQNDQFLAKLVEEHAAALETACRERDAAIQRVRELSRELTRSGASSCAAPSEVPLGRPPSIPSQPVSATDAASSPELTSQEIEEVTRTTPKFDTTDLAGTSGDER